MSHELSLLSLYVTMFFKLFLLRLGYKELIHEAA